MALVDLSMEETVGRLAGREERLSVAVSNSPRSSVISGDPKAVQQVMAELERDDVFCRLVKVDVASHSPQWINRLGSSSASWTSSATGKPAFQFGRRCLAVAPRLMSSMQPIGATTYAKPCVLLIDKRTA